MLFLPSLKLYPEFCQISTMECFIKNPVAHILFTVAE